MKDFNINIKIKLAALWTSVTLCYIYGDYFELYVPGKVSGMFNSETILNSPSLLFAASLIMVIPPLMIPFSVFLKPSINKWLNVFFGTLFSLLMILIAIGSLTPWYSFYVFLAIVETILTATIVWNALKWPRTKVTV